MPREPSITESEYNDLVHITDLLIDHVGSDENHKLASMLNMSGDLVHEYEEYHVGDISINLLELDIDYDNIYSFMSDEKPATQQAKFTGVLEHDREKLDFVGYYDFEKDIIKVSDPIRKKIGITTFANYHMYREVYDDPFFTRFLGLLFRTGRFSYVTDVYDDFENEIDKCF